MLSEPLSGQPGRPVAFYVHHHGSGHSFRCQQIAAAWPDETPIHVFTSAPKYFEGWQGGALHELPPDTEPGRDPGKDLLKQQILHYAPTNLPTVSKRMAIIASWIAEHQPKLFIVDLSCEIALFARLCGAKVALVRLHGLRQDPAHEAAYQLADTLLAPFPPCLDDEHTREWVRKKTTYLGLFSRYDTRTEDRHNCINQISQLNGLPSTSSQAPGNPDPASLTLVTITNGSGGADRSVRYWEVVAQDNPGHHFFLLGKLDVSSSCVDNLTVVGYAPDTYPYLKAADIIVGSGGTNTMSEVAAVEGRFLSLPELRPFHEQTYKMQALSQLGLTRALDPDLPAQDWKKWLRRAGDLQPARWRKARGSIQLEPAIKDLAARYSGEGVSAPMSRDGGTVG